MRKKIRPDDDLKGIPSSKTAVSELDGLRIYVDEEGNRVITKLDKEKPELKLLLRNLDVEPGNIVVNLNCQNGAIGVSIAAANKDTKVYLTDSNLLNLKIAGRNIEKNLVDNCEVLPEVGEGGLVKKGVVADVVVYEPEKYLSDETVMSQIKTGRAVLKQGGKFYLVVSKKGGASKHLSSLSQVFGEENVTVLSRNAGFRIAVAVNTESAQDMELQEEPRYVEFDIKNEHFSVKTESSLFSKDKLDEGTRFLLETAPLTDFHSLLDLGCGWGAIGIVAGRKNQTGSVIMTDVDFRATEVARQNVQNQDLSNRISVVPTDDIRQLPQKFDLILSNPPFHQNYRDLTKLFSAARKVLEKDGKIYIVVEKTHVERFEDILKDTFRTFQSTPNENGTYFVLQAGK